MNIIDSRGRVFGKFNLFDILVVFIFILSGAALYIGISYPQKISRIITGEPNYKMVRIEIVVDKDMEWLEDNILPGDIMRDMYNAEAARILDKQRMSLGINRYLVIGFRLRVNVEPKGILTFKKRQLRPGDAFIFESNKLYIRGYVLKIGDL